MSSKSDLWKTLASEFEQDLWRDLSGGRGTLRTRGAVRARGRAQLAGEPSKPTPVVVVEVLNDRPSPTAEKVKQTLGLQGKLDLYYLIPGKSWAALGARELNPDDPECGRDYELILRNLSADYVLMPAGRGRPEWCHEKTDVKTW